MDSSSEDHAGIAPDLPAAGGAVPASRCSRSARLRRLVAEWHARAHSRYLLAQLDEHMLRDIGIDPGRVWQETGKWFWQP
jgi:uncharacterized protein YjiS (DUF1127 family)